MTKICPKCKEEKPLTLEWFGKCKSNKNGFNTYCKECARIKGKEWSRNNPEQKNEMSRNYRKISR